MNIFFRRSAILFLTSLFLGSHINMHAQGLPLSYESKKFIAIAAAIGAIVGGGMGLLIGCEEQDKNTELKNATFWTRAKSFRWVYHCIIPATVGALIAGGISSFFTAEAYLDAAQQKLSIIEHDMVFKKALKSSDIDEMAKCALDDKFPVIATYKKINSFYDSLDRIKEYLLKVIHSGIQPLVTTAKEILERLENYENTLMERLIVLKNGSPYLLELVESNKLATIQRIASTSRPAARVSWRYVK